MAIFGRKRIAQLEAENASLRLRLERCDTEGAAAMRDASALRNQVDFLIRTIRKTDDIIFSISQCTDWNQMRPRVAQLTDEMTARKVAESNRISSLITSELHSTYKPSDEPKQLGKLNGQ